MANGVENFGCSNAKSGEFLSMETNGKGWRLRMRTSPTPNFSF